MRLTPLCLVLLGIIVTTSFGLPATINIGGIYLRSIGGVPCCVQEATGLSQKFKFSKNVFSNTLKAASLAIDNLNNDPDFLPNGPKVVFNYTNDEFSPSVCIQFLFNIYKTSQNFYFYFFFFCIFFFWKIKKIGWI